MDFLAEVTDAAERDPVRDVLSDEIGAPDPVVWLDELPDGVRLTPQSHDDTLLRIRPPRSTPQPPPPAQLAEWVNLERLNGFDGPEPELISSVLLERNLSGMTEPPSSVERAFDRWLTEWRQWAGTEKRSQQRRRLYEQLETAVKTIEQQDDEYEFVLAAGLICWQAPDGERIRRHLVSEPVVAKLDRATAEITVLMVDGKRRSEDREIFDGQETYQPERGRAARHALLNDEVSLLDARLLANAENWLGVALTEAVVRTTKQTPSAARLPETPELSASPALLLRPRSRVLLAEVYRRIAEALRQPNAQVPVALAQLIVDTEPAQRDRWLAQQGAVTSDVFGEDPLFPLPTNDEQRRVIDVLRTETGVVVQGPPGTGKTHTIANLVCALLARGLRVLVTSQKDQALRVLREKIPPEIRRLCVLLAGGSKDAAKELEQGLDALSEAITSPNASFLEDRARALGAERHELKARSAVLNDQIRTLRSVEDVQHPPVTPGYNTNAYTGTLTDIVREVKRNATAFGWMVPIDPRVPDVPPLSTENLIELLTLLRGDSPNRRARANQQVPAQEALPNMAELPDILTSERRARQTAHADTSELTQQLATTSAENLHQLQQLRSTVQARLRDLGFGENSGQPPEQAWIRQAVTDRLTGRRAGLWGHLLEVHGEASRLQQRLQAQGVRFAIDIPPIQTLGIGRASGLLKAGRRLRDHMAQGKKLRAVLPKSAAQKEAADLLELVRVDGQSPTSVAQLDAVLAQLEAEVAAAQLVAMWADVGVAVPTKRLTATLSELCDNDALLHSVKELGTLCVRAKALLGPAMPYANITTVEGLVCLLDAVPAALRYVELDRARTQVDALERKIQTWGSNVPYACPELGLLLQAIHDRDLDAYHRGIEAIELARAEQSDELRRAQLVRTLRGVHPQLCDLLERTAADTEWDDRLRDLRAAWAWSKAEQFVRAHRNADEERRLQLVFDEVEGQINRVTGRLAAVRALQACLERMSDTHARALRTYREHMSHVGAGTGTRAREFRKAARAAMEKARDAVPAWVVPLSNLLDNITANHNAFDVVIVDEASQAGLEQLFLLWMAPRVIVVGDDKQCTPGVVRMGKLDPVFDRLNEYLPAIDSDIRFNFTPKSNLYGLLSARSGKDSVIRLREHFRCMPEIINWSSSQFYGEEGHPGLVPLRERTAYDLDPLKVVFVEGGYTEGRDVKRRNPTEAKQIVTQLVECLADPRYDGKTFGVVVLPGSGFGQVKLIDHEINVAIAPEQRADRKIRVGTPPDFQGDERDVVFLSMVVAGPPRALNAAWASQAYNVAASRAKDQMWIFASVRLDQIKPHDLRASLLTYMLNPPSVFGESPALDKVSATMLCPPFDSLMEQRVFRKIKRLGYHVVPQHKVGTRSLDLVVVGSGGRLAVECDGHRWHTSPDQQISDARRDRELRRMGWEVIRIRESEFEFDPERELAPLWKRLAERRIRPHDLREAASGDWTPVDLPDTEDDNDTGEET